MREVPEVMRSKVAKCYFVLLLASILVMCSGTCLAKYIEERDDVHRISFARGMHDEVLIENQEINRWILLDLNTENDARRYQSMIELNSTVYTSDSAQVLALGVFFDHNDKNGRVYFPDKDNAIFFHNRVFDFKTRFMKEYMQMHGSELRWRILQAETVTVKVKLEDAKHNVAIYSFDLPPDILAEWKQVVDISLKAEQGVM